MNQLDRVPKEILNYWKTFETSDAIIQYALSGYKYESYIFFLGEKLKFSPLRVFAFADKDSIIYYWRYDGVNIEQYSEKDFIKLLKLKAFI